MYDPYRPLRWASAGLLLRGPCSYVAVELIDRALGAVTWDSCASLLCTGKY